MMYYIKKELALAAVVLPQGAKMPSSVSISASGIQAALLLTQSTLIHPDKLVWNSIHQLYRRMSRPAVQ
jgi:hypothetical protein